MANRHLFRSLIANLLPPANARNEERAPAYALSPEQALAQYVCTGCLNGTFYASADTQLAKIQELCGAVAPEFVAKLALYARREAYMKDTPALLCAVLSVSAPELLEIVFPRVIDSGKMLRNFVQIVRSGVVGRKSLGSRPKRLLRAWLAEHTAEQLLRASVGNQPSLADVIKMVHPKPKSNGEAALFGYFLGRVVDENALPEAIRGLEAFKRGETRAVPEVPFELLTALELGRPEWSAIARRASWQTTRASLNTFARHGVFADERLVARVAERLADAQAIEKARAFPYQLLAAYRAAGEEVPEAVKQALAKAAEIAVRNVPKVKGRVVVCPDTSGSMVSPVTGMRKGSTSKMRCIDVAALVAAAVLRHNPEARVMPFANAVKKIRLDPEAALMENAERLAELGGGGTKCSAPLAKLNAERAKVDLVIFVSDYESWVDARSGRGTATMQEWSRLRAANSQARLVCIDVQPYGTTQACEREDVLNVGGFSDAVFEVIAKFAAGELAADHWVKRIEARVL